MRLKDIKDFIDPEYIKKLTSAESSGDPNAEAETSTATGLFQFTKDTWKDVVEKYNLSYSLQDRKDPKKSLKVLELFTEDNRKYLKNKLGREPNHTELYLAHFKGRGGAAKILTSDPRTSIEELVSKDEISSNKNVFKNIRTASDLYNWAADKFGGKEYAEVLAENDDNIYVANRDGSFSAVNPETATEEEKSQSNFLKLDFYKQQVAPTTTDRKKESSGSTKQEEPKSIAQEIEKPKKDNIFDTQQALKSKRALDKKAFKANLQDIFKTKQPQPPKEEFQRPNLEDAYNYIDIETYQDGGEIPTSKNGLYDYPKQTVKVPTTNGNITMEGINYPVLGIADTGEQILMQPGKKYNFKGAKEVLEIPQL